eukprot:NODE_918_length_1235_cov_773.793423_g686_i0.p1 GENE.NODE_918_length_1235_cov_773.793423_g686_i0~~NODE_918_length_1235_cov_773.793423_g686_i0.p1  ORF type:complete len:297 (+),score=75.66 NODE_918_length_1235_cov_773.793423_g686_i0:96-986(+)
MAPKKPAPKKPVAKAPTPKAGSKAKAPVPSKGPAKKGGAKAAPVKAKKSAAAKRDITKKGKFQNLIVARPKLFGIGQDIKPKRDLTRFVRWPLYVRRQRQKRVLMRRLKVPPAINQFRKTLQRLTKKQLVKFSKKYKPESAKQKKERLKALAEKKSKGKNKAPEVKKPAIKCGIKRVTRLVETKRAQLVVIAHDVEPLELVIWLPALCHKLGVPYCIMKSKSAVGRMAGFKKASCIAFDKIKPEDKKEFDKLQESIKMQYADRFEATRKEWGGLKLGKKHELMMKKRADRAKKAGT